MNLKITEEYLRNEHGLSDDFHFYKWECFPKGHETLYVELEGVVAPLKLRGPQAGRPNWRHEDKATRRTFVVSNAKYEEIEREYTERTGLCVACMGTKQEVERIDFVNKRTDYRTCSKCNGTGSAMIAAPERRA